MNDVLFHLWGALNFYFLALLRSDWTYELSQVKNSCVLTYLLFLFVCLFCHIFRLKVSKEAVFQAQRMIHSLQIVLDKCNQDEWQTLLSTAGGLLHNTLVNKNRQRHCHISDKLFAWQDSFYCDFSCVQFYFFMVMLVTPPLDTHTILYRYSRSPDD